MNIDHSGANNPTTDSSMTDNPTKQTWTFGTGQASTDPLKALSAGERRYISKWLGALLMVYDPTSKHSWRWRNSYIVNSLRCIACAYHPDPWEAAARGSYYGRLAFQETKWQEERLVYYCLGARTGEDHGNKNATGIL